MQLCGELCVALCVELRVTKQKQSLNFSKTAGASADLRQPPCCTLHCTAMSFILWLLHRECEENIMWQCWIFDLVPLSDFCYTFICKFGLHFSLFAVLCMYTIETLQ